MKHLITYKLFEGRESTPLTREKKDASLFTQDEVMDIENMFLEYADKYSMQEVAYEHDDDGNVNYPIYDVNGVDFQYHVGRYRNVAIDICYTEDVKVEAQEIKKDLESNFLPRLKRFGYDIVFFGEDGGDWKDNGDSYIDNKWEITIVITKRD